MGFNIKEITYEICMLCFIDVPNTEITCKQIISINENENFSCLCRAIRSHFSPTATWVKNGIILGIPSSTAELYLHDINKKSSGTYICRAQLYTLIGEKSVQIMVQCKYFIDVDLLTTTVCFCYVF